MAIETSASIVPPGTTIPASATPAVATDRHVNLLDYARADLEAFYADLGEKRFRTTQTLKWIHQHGVHDIQAMTNLGKALRARLLERAHITPPEVVLDQRSDDGTHKWLLRLTDGNCIETVFIPDGKRGTLCVSSQVGCSLNCDFCSTATQGFNRNLTVAEIIGQLWVARRSLGQEPQGDKLITNVVMMGMGEPLLNFDNVVKAMDLMLDDFGYGLAWKRVTLSTAGVIPALDRLREASPVSLAVSLHAPDDALRDRLVPLNRKYPIAEVMAACRRFVAGRKHRSVTFEYVMLAGVNDSPAQARQLAKLLHDVPAKVNLIPFNPFRGSGYRTSDPTTIDRFRDILLARGLICITRKTRGEDIDAACGQLVGEFRDRSLRRVRFQAARELRA